MQAVDEGGVLLPQHAGDILKIHVQPLIPLGGHGLQDLADEGGLAVLADQDHLRPLAGEGAALREGGQVHQRCAPQAAGLPQQLPVVQGQQAAAGVDAVGEGGQLAHVGQGGAQQGPLYEGVGVAVCVGSTQLLVGVGDHQPLPRLDRRLSPQPGVDGTFCSEWMTENKSGKCAHFLATRQLELEHPLEKVGKELRTMMSWLKK